MASIIGMRSLITTSSNAPNIRLKSRGIGAVAAVAAGGVAATLGSAELGAGVGFGAGGGASGTSGSPGRRA